ncbi:hypothetical protein QAD02_024428 [Eretmocerus hayati]|uniref:Uncharacterized protein n=1 Tax=Eretmocerus hayati TaxID=131215 RepID=A0ACC2Q0B1_9HYME|nr:hypothetical protein QAD02_024428 [Eretmocerus hayati]
MVVLRAQQLDTGLHHRLRPFRFDIDNDISMFEAAKDNRCSEYSPWSYNLLGTPGSKTTLEDDDGQDLNNSMVNDIVAKLLDDDCISSNDSFTSRCNGNPLQNGMSTAQDCKSRLNSTAYPHNTNGFRTAFPPVQRPNGSLNTNDDSHELRCAYDELNTLGVNAFTGQQNLIRGNSCNNGYLNNLQRISQTSGDIQQSRHQYSGQVINEGSFSCMQSSFTPLSTNGLLTTSNSSVHSPQPTNWSESLGNSDGGKDRFGHYPQLQSCNTTDYNFNMAALNLALDSPGNVALNDVHLHYDAGSVNSRSSPVTNAHDSYNVTANGQSYRPSSTVTDLSADSGFLSNSPLQHFSPPEHTLQNCFPNDFQRGKFDEYKEYHESSNLNVNNLVMSNEQIFTKQQQHHHHHQQLYQQNARAGNKFDNSMAVDQAFKRFLNSQYPNIVEQQQQQQYSPQLSDFDINNGLSLVDQQRLDAAILKMLSSKNTGSNGCTSNQSREKQVYSPVGYQRSMIAMAAAAAAAAARESELQQMKFNYQSANDCHRFAANNADSLKALHQQNAQVAFQNSHKRSNNVANASKTKANYDFANGVNFPTSNSSAHHQQSHHVGSSCVNGVDPEIFNHLFKRQQQQHQQQQQQRLKTMPPMSSAADVLFNASLLQSAGNAGVFPVHSVMPIPMAVPPSMSFFEAGLGIRNGTPIKRSGPARVLYLRLEQTYEQFKQLEKERKKCEAGLAAHFPGKKVSSANNIPIPRLQGSPSRVDRLIIDHYREHARVITLVAKMEHLRGACINQRVHKAMEQWLDTIKFVQDCRKQEITNGTKRQKDNLHCMAFQDEKDILILADSIYKLTKASRYARSAMYNAMQSTLLYDGGIETKILETNQDVVLNLVPKISESSDQTNAATTVAPVTAASIVTATKSTAEESADRT